MSCGETELEARVTGEPTSHDTDIQAEPNPMGVGEPPRGCVKPSWGAGKLRLWGRSHIVGKGKNSEQRADFSVWSLCGQEKGL